jgi:DNA-binding NarL/FixJ family response regulator
MDRIRVLVVDDQAIVRRGIIDILAEREEMEVVGEAKDGLEAVEKAKELVPDVVIMDLMMPNCTGLEATQILQTEMPQLSIIILTVSDKEADLFDAMKFGARGYLVKNTEPEELIQAVIHTAKGGVTVSPTVATMLLSEFRAAKEPEPETTSLSPREQEVLQLVAKGAGNKEIASALFISENTVKTHLRNIMDKLHLANRSQAAAYAVRKGFIRNNGS